jgi:hydrogenase maturation protease
MTNPEQARTVVLGLGNMLMADDGVGLAALARLDEDWFVPPAVALVDGGTWGMNLLPVIESADRVIILDAIDLNGAAGTVYRLEKHEIPRFLGQKLSPHQIDLREILALAELRGTLPGEIIALGIQPARVEMSTTLTPTVEEHLDQLVQMAAATLQQWGVAVCRWNVNERKETLTGCAAGEAELQSPVPGPPSPSVVYA